MAGHRPGNLGAHLARWLVSAALALAVHLTAATPDAAAQGGYADVLLRMGIGSRSEAMGRAYTAVIGNPESAYYNPASTTLMEKRVVDLSIRALSLDRSYAYAGFSTALHPGGKESKSGKGPLGGGLALSWIHAAVSDIDGRDFDGQKFGTFSNNQNIFNFTFGLRVSRRMALGLTTRLLWNRFPALGEDDATISSRAFGIDLGALINLTDGVWLGGVFKNINAKFTWDSSELYDRGTSTTDRFPKMWRIGLSTTRLWPKTVLAVDLESSDKQDPRLYVGGDAEVADGVHLRAGLRAGTPTFGAAYRFKLGSRMTELHYAFVAQPEEARSEHIFSWSFIF